VGCFFILELQLLKIVRSMLLCIFSLFSGCNMDEFQNGNMVIQFYKYLQRIVVNHNQVVSGKHR
jgi:hypothetical protein